MLFAQFFLILFFISIVFLHIAKKKIGIAIIYGVQSFATLMLLVISFFETKSISLLLVVLLVLIIKVILTPVFIIQLIEKYKLKFSVSTYANMPLTLIIVAVLTAIAYSDIFKPLVAIIPVHKQFLSLALSAFFISLFLIVNRKGALSQIIGILSLENSIVAFAFFAGLEQSPALQAGIIFDLFVWFIIATIFISMIYKHFGSLDVTEMKHLKD